MAFEEPAGGVATGPTHKAWWEYEEQLARLAFDLRGRLAFDLRGEATAMRLPPCERPTRRMSAFF